VTSTELGLSERTAGLDVNADIFSAEDRVKSTRLFTSGESVWLLHAILLFVAVGCLVAVWRSVEQPRRLGWKS
jgi:hypothetical protein